MKLSDIKDSVSHAYLTGMHHVIIVNLVFSYARSVIMAYIFLFSHYSNKIYVYKKCECVLLLKSYSAISVLTDKVQYLVFFQSA